jgi:hypothetical protein
MSRTPSDISIDLADYCQPESPFEGIVATASSSDPQSPFEGMVVGEQWPQSPFEGIVIDNNLPYAEQAKSTSTNDRKMDGPDDIFQIEEVDNQLTGIAINTFLGSLSYGCSLQKIVLTPFELHLETGINAIKTELTTITAISKVVSEIPRGAVDSFVHRIIAKSAKMSSDMLSWPCDTDYLEGIIKTAEDRRQFINILSINSRALLEDRLNKHWPEKLGLKMQYTQADSRNQIQRTNAHKRKLDDTADLKAAKTKNNVSGR